MRIALVHDYLTQMGGAERVLLAFHDLFPEAPIYTSLYEPGAVDPRFREMEIHTSFMRRLPGARRHHRWLLPLYPYAFDHLDLRAFDLVLSDSSAFAKGVLTRPDALHICYCHTPMRWAWNYEDYIERERLSPTARLLLRPLVSRLRLWDYASAARVDYFIANSPAVGARIAKYYRRESVVIPPPVDTTRFQPAHEHERYFLLVSRLVPYKHIDIAVEAFSRNGLPLRIIGAGRDAGRLRKLAARNVRFLGHLPDDDVCRQMARCRALIFPGEEDFGLTPIEAQACGRPVIAYAGGGALTSIVEGSTGLFFAEQTADALMRAVARFDDAYFDPEAIRRHAEEFETQRFLRRISHFIDTHIATHPTLARRAALEDADPSPAVRAQLARQFDTSPLLDQPTLPSAPLASESADTLSPA
ncbi:MAG: glycosyltransferase [Ktedonobacterales bacterium]|nr:glycosyltransferase [Ktedonobacterales bacterium]